MRLFVLSCMAGVMTMLSTGCETKVINQPPVAGPTVIEKDRPIVSERTPEVQNNIHVDR